MRAKDYLKGIEKELDSYYQSGCPAHRAQDLIEEIPTLLKIIDTVGEMLADGSNIRRKWDDIVTKRKHESTN